MRRSIAWACCILVALQVTAGSLHAAALRRPALHWSRGEGAETCIDPKRLAQRVEAITGPVFVSATSADNSIEAHVERRAPDVFSVRVATANAAGATLGSRTLEFHAASCREIDEAVTLVIAVAIDPALGAAGLPDEVLEIVEAEEAPEPLLLAQLQAHPPGRAPLKLTTTIHEVPPSPPPAKPAPRTGQVDLEPTLAWGAAPTTAVGLLLAGALAQSRGFDFVVQLEAAHGVGSKTIDAMRSVSGGSLGLGVLACPRWELSQSVGLRACAGPFGGVAIADGHGFSETQVGVLPRYGASVRIDATFQLSGNWQLVAAANGTLDFATGEFVYHDLPDQPVRAHAPATLAVQIGLGPGVRF